MGMSEELQKLTGAWTTDVLPTKTTLTHINPTNIAGITQTLLLAALAYPTVTNRLDLYHLARAAKGAQASLLVVLAQHYIATATDTQELPLMTQIIWNLTMELQELEMGFNLYQMKLSMSANSVFALCFALLFAGHLWLCVWKRCHYFGACLVAGAALECTGYIARVLAIGHYLEKPQFLFQIIALTLAPAVVMAGVYFLLLQLVVVYGRQYSRLQPIWLSYIFIFCDMTLLAVQASGGGLAAIKLQNLESTSTGTHVMLSGIVFQVLSMTVFLWLLFDFLRNIYFKALPSVVFLARNTAALLFQTKHGRNLQETHLFTHYSPEYAHVWGRRVFGYYPLAIFVCVVLIYVRCVYRVAELSEGWAGYLITHEQYAMTLDGLMVLLACMLLVPFHPGFMMGRAANVLVRERVGRLDYDEKLHQLHQLHQLYSELYEELFEKRLFEYHQHLCDELDVSSSPTHSPYFVTKMPHTAFLDKPKVPVEAPSEVPILIPELKPEPAHQKDSWTGLGITSLLSKFKRQKAPDFGAVPYETTTEDPFQDQAPAPETKPRKPRLDTQSVVSNPYTGRAHSIPVAMPYDDFVTARHDADTALSYTRDEFLFSFE